MPKTTSKPPKTAPKFAEGKEVKDVRAVLPPEDIVDASFTPDFGGATIAIEPGQNGTPLEPTLFSYLGTTPRESPIVVLPTPFTDSRGHIQRVSDFTVGSVQVITTLAGHVRANHIHREDSHLCLLLSGKMEYTEREVTELYSDRIVYGKLTKRIITANEAFLTGPRVAHQMRFLEASTMLVLADRHRTPETYDADIIHVDPIHFEQA